MNELMNKIFNGEMEVSRFSINVTQAEVNDFGSFGLIFERALEPLVGSKNVVVGRMSADKFDELDWEFVEQDGSVVLFKSEENVPEEIVPVDQFWNEEKDELELPEFAEKTVHMATKISDLSQVGFVKLLEHKVTRFMLCDVASRGTFATPAWMWEE